MKFSPLRSAMLVFGLMLIPWATSALGQDSALGLRKEKLGKAKEHFSLGQQLIKEGNYSAANTEFFEAELMLQESAISPPESSSQVATGKKDKPESQEKQVEKAMTYYLEELKKETSNPDYYFNLGVDYLNKGQFVQAEESFKLAVNLNPLDKDACYNLGILYENYLGDNQKAKKYYQQYLNIAPDAPDAAQVKGWINAVKTSIGEK
jgi:tetratricopeptide (TPR) repeat protein